MPTVPKPPAAAHEPEADVLSTLRADGSRRWLRPILSSGRFLARRRGVAWALIVLFTTIPFLKVHGKPLLLLDVAHREFTIVGVTFLPTDTLLLALLILSIFITIFLLTALFGRVWCGWACPQTVYMEFVYRPLERWIEGRHHRTGTVPTGRLVLKYAAFLVISFYLANTFLAYFVGVERLAEWMTRSPFTHPGAFLVMAVTLLLMMIDFSFFREQMCTIACPYGRLQSVLLDRNSLIIAYDRNRGEPRGPLRRGAVDVPPKGDCIDCHLCVKTCPTGIDIRDGLQMECIGCAQCIDACDRVMDKIDRPRGLIRYGSEEGIETGRRRFLRPRVVIYPLLLTGLLTLLTVKLVGRSDVDVTVLRGRTTPYRVLEDGAVSNVVRVKITNRSEVVKTYDVRLEGDGVVASGSLPLRVPPGEAVQLDVEVILPRGRFVQGRAAIRLQLFDDASHEFAAATIEHAVLGPLYGGAEGGSG